MCQRVPAICVLLVLAGCEGSSEQPEPVAPLPPTTTTPPRTAFMQPHQDLPLQPIHAPMTPPSRLTQAPAPNPPSTSSTQPSVGPLEDIGFAVAADGQGNVLVAGMTPGVLDGASSHGGSDGFVAKWSADGEWLWTQQYGGDGGDKIAAIAIEPDGDIAIAGSTSGQLAEDASAGGSDAFVARLDPDGAVRWLRQYGSAGLDFANAIAVSADGSIYVASVQQQDGYAGQATGVLSRFEGDGTLLWQDSWGGTPGAEPAAVSERNGIVYVVGRGNERFDPDFWMPGGRLISDAFVRRYDASGQLTAEHTFASSDTSASAVAIDADGGAIVAGMTLGQLGATAYVGAFDVFLQGFGADGEPTWTAQLGTLGWDHAGGVAVLPGGDLLISGDSAGNLDDDPDTGYGAWMMRCDPKGKPRWVKQAFAQIAYGIAVTGDAAYTTGWLFSAEPPTAEAYEADAFVAGFALDGTGTMNDVLGSAAAP